MQKYLCMSKKSSNFAPKLRIMTKHFAELTTTELYEILNAYTHEEKTINP